MFQDAIKAVVHHERVKEEALQLLDNQNVVLKVKRTKPIWSKDACKTQCLWVVNLMPSLGGRWYVKLDLRWTVIKSMVGIRTVLIIKLTEKFVNYLK